MTVSIDAGHVRTARGHQGRTFEVMAAQVSNDDGMPVLFCGVPREADRQPTQLNGVLSGLGMTEDTEVTILSDGADGPRSLGEAASTGTVYHVLDWFHLAMRIQHAAQCAGGWPNNSPGDRRNRARFANVVEHIRWRLWHGQTGRALRDPAHIGGRQSEGERKNRGGQIGSQAGEGAGRTGDLRIRSHRSDHRLCLGAAG
jgi:hypothetical protein